MPKEISRKSQHFNKTTINYHSSATQQTIHDEFNTKKTDNPLNVIRHAYYVTRSCELQCQPHGIYTLFVLSVI